MSDRETWRDEAARLGFAAEADRLADALRAADPSSAPPAGPTRDRALAAVLAAARPAPALRAWWMGLATTPGRAVCAAVAAVAIVFALAGFGPRLAVGPYPLLWVGLLSPWVGVLWALAFTTTRRGIWADWQAMAPVSDTSRAVADWAAATAAASVLAGVFDALLGTSGGFGAVWIAWVGPFALGSAIMAAIAWRWGLEAGLAVSMALWGVPAALAAGGWQELGPSATSALLWYAQAPGAPGHVALDCAALGAAALAIAVASWRGGAWTSR